MPTPQYIHTLFSSLETAVEHGIIRKWSIHGANIAIDYGTKRTIIPQLQAADYLVELLESHVHETKH